MLADNGKDVTGKWLLRSTGSDAEYIVSVVFKSQATHHQAKRKGPGELFLINNGPTETPCNTMGEVAIPKNTHKKPKQIIIKIKNNDHN